MAINARIMANHVSDAGTITATSEAYAVTNLQDNQVGMLWRSTDTSDQIIDNDLGVNALLSCAILYNHNLSAGGKIKITIAINDAMVTNNLLWSDDFTKSAWVKSQLISVTSGVARFATEKGGAVVAIAGVAIAGVAVAGVATGVHYFEQGGIPIGWNTGSVYAAADGLTKIALSYINGTDGEQVTKFDLTLGTILSGTGVITAVDGGYRLSITRNCTVIDTFRVSLLNALGEISYYSAAGLSLLVWDADSTATITPAPHIKTQGTTATGFAEVVYEKWINARVPTFGWRQGLWRIGQYGGYENIENMQPLIVDYFAPIIGRYIQITLVDNTNSDGYLQAGRLLVGEYIEPAINVAYDADINIIDESVLNRSRGGVIRSLNKPVYRQIVCNWQYLTDAERTKFINILLSSGKRKDVFLSIYPEEGTIREIESTILGRIIDWSSIQHVAQTKTRSLHAFNLQLSEAL